jgi:hypothetical protein
MERAFVRLDNGANTWRKKERQHYTAEEKVEGMLVEAMDMYDRRNHTQRQTGARRTATMDTK